MTYYCHTTNPGWLEHPDTWGHLGERVVIQSDLALRDDEFRLYDDAGPVTRTMRIGEDSGRRIRTAIEKHRSASPPPAPREPDPPTLQAHGNQLSLF